MRRRGFLTALAGIAVASAVQCFGAKKPVFQYSVTGQFKSDPICIIDATVNYKGPITWLNIEPLPHGLGFSYQRVTTKGNIPLPPLAIQWDTPTKS